MCEDVCDWVPGIAWLWPIIYFSIHPRRKGKECTDDDTDDRLEVSAQEEIEELFVDKRKRQTESLLMKSDQQIMLAPQTDGMYFN